MPNPYISPKEAHVREKVLSPYSTIIKKGLLAITAFLILAAGGGGNAWALPGANGPHADYRPGYSSINCGGTNAACHVIYQGSFLPQTLDNLLGYTPANESYTNFCLSCHNASGEAHEKAAGTPSNNTYTNFTGLTPGNRGVSHSWKGAIGNAGTRIPTQPFFNRTGYMPKGIVACQTCHNEPIKGSEAFFPANQPEPWAATVDQGDHINYVISLGGPTSTPEYLNKYIRVFRSAAYLASPPTNRRDWKQYLVVPSEYTYNNNNITITFKTSQGTSYIYADLAEPYLRGSNAGNALCTDCHIDRVDASVSHPSGSGAKNNHPTGINYGYKFGLHSTLKPAPTGNAYIEAGQVLCTSCHDPHNAASNNGQILRESDETRLCADCHRTKLDGYSTAGSVNIHYGAKHVQNGEPPTVCTDCHGHNSNNVLLVKDVINGKRVNFQSFTGARSFGPDTGYGVCEVCHTKTNHHLSSNDPGGQGHNAGLDCVGCHKHETGFQPSGCDGCHGFPPGTGGKYGPVYYGWADNTGNKHPAHAQYIQEKYGLTGSALCACCHEGKPGTVHPELLDTAFINITSHIYWQGRWGTASFSGGGTIGKVNTSDDSCTNVACHSSSGTRLWNDAPTTCGSCHEYPGTAGDWTAGNGHSVRFDLNGTHLPTTGYNAATDTYDAMTADTSRCGKCHPNNSANHRNGTINAQASGNAACGSGGFTFNVATSHVKVTCSNARCHSGTTTPNWYGGTATCGVCHGNAAKSSEAPATPEDKDNCSNTGRGLHGVHMNYSSASYGKIGANRGNCAYCHAAPPDSAPTVTHNNGFVSITGHSATGRQNFNSVGLTYDFGTAACSNACHRNRAETAPWGNFTGTAVKLACRACHDDVQDKAASDFSLSGAHKQHLNSAITVNGGQVMGAAGDAGCQNCHPDNRNDRWSQGKADDGSKKAYPHASDGTNVVPDNAVINTGVGAAKSGLNTTCTGSCHRNTTVAKWGDATLNCDACHYYSDPPTLRNDSAVVRLSGSHSSHFKVAKNFNIHCASCHVVPLTGDTSHAHSLPPVPDNAVILPSLGWDVTTHRCLTTGGTTGQSCHGQANPLMNVTTPDFTKPGQYSSDECSICHK